MSYRGMDGGMDIERKGRGTAIWLHVKASFQISETPKTQVE
jgi:hypothetical protein